MSFKKMLHDIKKKWWNVSNFIRSKFGDTDALKAYLEKKEAKAHRKQIAFSRRINRSAKTGKVNTPQNQQRNKNHLNKSEYCFQKIKPKGQAFFSERAKHCYDYGKRIKKMRERMAA